jgi:hypothetical protein
MSNSIFNSIFDENYHIKSHSDVLILSKSTALYDSFFKVLEKYSIDFSKISIGKANVEDFSLIVNNAVKKGIFVIVLDCTIEDAVSFSSSELVCFSNKIILNSNVVIHNLGFQRHICTLNDIIHLETISNKSASLGMLRNNMEDAEPLLREQESIFVDFNSCSSLLVNNDDALPSGLNCEELIQLLRYGAQSPNARVLSFSNQDDYSLNEMHTMAMSVWYFLEGLQEDVLSAELASEKIFTSIDDVELEFAINKELDKYWVRDFKNDVFNPCSKSDYDDAQHGVLTKRLYKLFVE